ncbi:sulfite exporter TauE/SafE family protein [Acetivibrio saccincola]|uniref:Probable membrane transporter protein n=1 Tax=Acetivibrio saccincola TaxID=1677857 RepID=A0A2S8REW5_9FIRM|nr:sulfite exporter TauE/SafE family protein [Acetivibrio saccincola]NLW26194.1 sulfite exporter TauE/SafE family protein [Acetivibrio saccincola]PQQ68329.1 permease [Acetivibrio saccincola]HQD29173.1 sulfite exporter TauE/SafE family protein [Acetivibrio saccincola]
MDLLNKFAKADKKYFKYIVIGMVTGIANGLFGSGGGTLAVPAMVYLLGSDEHKAHATAISIILPLTIVSSFFYIKNNLVDWTLTYKVVTGGIVGGYIGAKLLNICPAGILRKIFAIFIIAAAIRMIM